MGVMDEARFSTGRAFADYSAASIVAGPVLRSNYAGTVIPAGAAAALNDLVRRAGGRVNVAVVSEEWCPDCQDNLPVLARLADSVPGMSLRVFGRDASPDLVEEYSVGGKMRIPTAVFYDPAWRELGRWIERPAKATELLEKAATEVRRTVREQNKGVLRDETIREVIGIIRRALS